jgi:CRP/FNR family transcriptional regulator
LFGELTLEADGESNDKGTFWWCCNLQFSAFWFWRGIIKNPGLALSYTKIVGLKWSASKQLF